MEATALILFVTLTALLFRILVKCQLNQMVKHESNNRLLTVGLLFFLTVFLLLCYVPAALQICSLTYLAISVSASLLIAFLSYRKTSKYTGVPKLTRLYSVVLPLALSSILNIGVIFFCRWLFPDVTTIQNHNGNYEFTSQHTWCLDGRLKPTGSYVANETSDTLYRVVVSYAYLGEEVYNHYNIPDTINPHSISRIPCPPNYVVREILPIMLPSYGRFGRVRTRLSYIATRPQLDAFVTGNFQNLGIKENVRVHSFDLKTNPIIWEDPERIRVVEQTIDKFSR